MMRLYHCKDESAGETIQQMPATMMMMMILTMTGLYHGKDKSAYEYIEDAGHDDDDDDFDYDEALPWRG